MFVKKSGYFIERSVKVDDYGKERLATEQYYIYRNVKVFGIFSYKDYVEEMLSSYGGSFICKKSFNSREGALQYIEDSLLMDIPKNQTITESEPVEHILFLDR